jgi:hypothetical protein
LLPASWDECLLDISQVWRALAQEKAERQEENADRQGENAAIEQRRIWALQMQVADWGNPEFYAGWEEWKMQVERDEGYAVWDQFGFEFTNVARVFFFYVTDGGIVRYKRVPIPDNMTMVDGSIVYIGPQVSGDEWWQLCIQLDELRRKVNDAYEAWDGDMQGAAYADLGQACKAMEEHCLRLVQVLEQVAKGSNWLFEEHALANAADFEGEGDGDIDQAWEQV